MARGRGQEVRYTLSADSRGFEAAAARARQSHEGLTRGVATGTAGMTDSFDKLLIGLNRVAAELKKNESQFNLFFKGVVAGAGGKVGEMLVEQLAGSLNKIPALLSKVGSQIGSQVKNIKAQLAGAFSGGGGSGGGGAAGFAAGFVAGPVLAFGAAVAGVTAGIGLLAAGAMAAMGVVKSLVGVFSGAVSGLTQYASGVSDLSAKTGLSTDAVQQFGFAAKLTGTTVDAVAAGMKNMQVKLVEGDSAFRRMGVSLKELKQLTPDQQFLRVAEAIRNIKDPAQQAAAAVSIFGKQGIELLPAIKAGFTDIATEARKLGIVISKEVVQSADRLGDDLDKISTAWAAVKMNVAAGAVGGGGPMSTMLQAVADLNKLVVQHRPVITAFFQAIADAARDAVAVVGTLVSGMRQLAQFLPASAKGFLDRSRAGSGLSGGAKFTDAMGRPLAADLAHLDPTRTGSGVLGPNDKEIAAAKKMTEAYRDWFKVLRDINDEFESMHREMQFSNQFNLTGVAKLPGVPLTDKEQRAALDAARAAGIKVSEGDMAAALARQASLDAGNTFEKGSMTRIRAGIEESNNGLRMGDKLAKGMAKAVNLVADAFQLMGVKADSTMGKVGAVFGGVGAGMAAGASIGTMFGGPAGTGIGAVIGGALGGIASLFGIGAADKQRREEERKRAEEQRKRTQEAARGMRAQGVEGLADHGASFFGKVKILTAEDARRQGTLFAAAWGTVVKEKGVVAAADAFGEVFAQMGKQMQEAGIEPPAWFKEIRDSYLMGGGESISNGKRQKIGADGRPVFNADGSPKMIETFQTSSGMDPVYRDIAERAFSGAQFMKALGQSSGIVGEDSFRAFEEEARVAFGGGHGRAIELGKDEASAVKAGFGAANPLLKEILNESIVSGTTISADIQELIDQAGIVPDVDIQQLDELRQIRAAVQVMAGAGFAGGGGAGTGAGAGHGQINPDIYADLPQMEGGGRRRPGSGGGGGTPAVIHDDETVVPDSEAGDWAAAVLGGSSNAGTVDVALGAIRAELKALRNQPVVAPQVQLLVDTSGLGRNNQEAFLQQMDERVSRAFEPGSPNYRRLVKAIKRHSGG